MGLSDEGMVHEALRGLEGQWEINTDFGVLKLALTRERVGYGSKRGVPDEIVHVELRITFWGRETVLRAPVLIEAETQAGLQGAMTDLREYVKRNLAGERRQADLVIPMVVVGTGFGKRTEKTHLSAEIQATEVAAGTVPGFSDTR